MFQWLMNLFRTVLAKAKPDAVVHRQAGASKQRQTAQKPARQTAQPSVPSASLAGVPTIDLNSAFYDVLLGKATVTHDTVNDFEQRVLHDVGELLAGDDIDNRLIPKLPDTVMELLNELRDDNTTVDELTKLINKDPGLAGDVLRLANSPYFKASQATITSIDTAVRLIGQDGLKAMLSTLAMQQVLKVKPIYFKLFGEVIWTHSLDCATTCRKLAKQRREDELLAHLTGLIHDIGKIVIFQILVNAFQKMDSAEQPESTAFRRMMTEQSVKLSVDIARQWGLPDEIVRALDEQVRKPFKMSPLGEILFVSNRVSEVKMLLNGNLIEKQQAEAFIVDLGFAPDAAQAMLTAVEPVQ